MVETVATGYLAHNAGELYWEAAGAGPPVVLVHGNTFDARMWDDQFTVLAKRFRVIRYDVRGYGRSSVPTGPYRNHEDLAAVLDAHGLPRAAVVGLSMGGGIASAFAVDQPERVSRLVLIDSTLGGHKWSPEVFEVLEGPPRTAREQGLAAGKEQWLTGALFALAREQPNVIARIREMVDDWSGWRWVNADPQVGLDPPAAARLGELAMPVLVLVGERDLADFQEIAERIARGAPNAQRVVIPNVGHMSNMEAPAAVNQALLAFLSADG
jgi:pimeloyl-ACP methyl ester carboxylesterase